MNMNNNRRTIELFSQVNQSNAAIQTVFLSYIAILIISSHWSTLFLLSQIPIPVPIRNEIRLVITRVYITSLEKIDFFVIFPFSLLSLEDSELFLLLHVFDGNFHSFGIFGRDVQSQTISDAVTPFEEEFEKGGVELGPLVALAEYPWIPTGSVLILFTYTPLSSSANVASSQLGLFGGDFGEEHGEFRLGVVERDIRADEMGETFVDDLFDSLCASRSILR